MDLQPGVWIRPEGEEHPGSGSMDVCQLPDCGIVIKTICWKGTGACGDEHFKAQHGHARVSEVLQLRGIGNSGSEHETAGDTGVGSGTASGLSGRFTGDGYVGSYPRPESKG